MNVNFKSSKCTIIDCEENLLFEALRNRNVYTIDIIDLTKQSVKYLAALDSLLWHKRLGHESFDLILKLSNKWLVQGLPTLKKLKEVTCYECKKSKQVKSFLI